jgi:hypothetical protein
MKGIGSEAGAEDAADKFHTATGTVIDSFTYRRN